MIAFWGKDRTVIGRPIAEAVPELKTQSFFELLTNVMLTGVSYHATDTAARLMRNGELETFYFDFSYDAISSANGETFILHTATDVTEAHHSKEQVNELHKDLSEVNQELGQTNALLQKTNSLLAESQHQTELQRNTLYDFFMQAPAGISILT
ncbi:MAG: hypothetical protein EOO68_15570, partial [Moraxellaceae bacterium]